MSSDPFDAFVKQVQRVRMRSAESEYQHERAMSESAEAHERFERIKEQRRQERSR